MHLPFRKKKDGKKPGGPPDDHNAVAYVFKKLDELRAKENHKENARSVIMGIGNDLKGDDGVGWYVVDKLKKSLGKKEDIRFIKTNVPENHIGEVRDFVPHLLVIIDAADFKGNPGDIRIIQAGEVTGNIGGTHMSPITLFMSLIEEEAPTTQIVLIGIQKKRNEFGMSLSKDVRNGGNELVKVLEKLYAGGLIEEEIEKELLELTNKNPLNKVSKVFEKITKSASAKKKQTTS